MKNIWKQTFDKIILNENQKQQILQNITSTQEEKRPMKKSFILILAVLTLTTATATTQSIPILGDLFQGDMMGIAINEAQTNKDGYTMTITDILGDNRNLYVAWTIKAPEGTILDADGYGIFDTTVTFKEDKDLFMSSSVQQLPDTDKTDNQIEFVAHITGYRESEDSFLGNMMNLTIRELKEYRYGQGETILTKEKFNFKNVPLDYESEVLQIQPNEEVEILGTMANITKVEITPLSVIVKFEHENLIGFEDWAELERDVMGLADCFGQQKIVITMQDGTEYDVPHHTKQNGNIILGGIGGSGYDNKEGWILVCRGFGEFLDVQAMDFITINGTQISLLQ